MRTCGSPSDSGIKIRNTRVESVLTAPVGCRESHDAGVSKTTPRAVERYTGQQRSPRYTGGCECDLSCLSTRWKAHPAGSSPILASRTRTRRPDCELALQHPIKERNSSSPSGATHGGHRKHFVTNLCHAPCPRMADLNPERCACCSALPLRRRHDHLPDRSDSRRASPARPLARPLPKPAEALPLAA